VPQLDYLGHVRELIACYGWAVQGGQPILGVRAARSVRRNASARAVVAQVPARPGEGFRNLVDRQQNPECTVRLGARLAPKSVS